MRPRAAAIAATGAVLVALTAGGAGRSASRLLPAIGWERISGPTGAGQQLGLARALNGNLHVIWNRGTSASATIFDTQISSAGTVLAPTRVASGWDGADGLALLRMRDGSLRLFATGGHAVGLPPGEVGVNTLSAPASGRDWTLDQGQVWGGAPAAAASFVGATLTKDGMPVTAWAGGGASNFLIGLLRQGTPVQACVCATVGSADVVTDGETGAVVLAGQTSASPAGTYVEQILPGIRGRHVLASARSDAGDYGISAREGAAGVYVAYSDARVVRLYGYGGGTTTFARGPFTVAKAFPGPDGRLWIDRGDNRGVFVTRSNRAVTRFEPVRGIAPPPGTTYLGNAQGEGSLGPLDLFVDASTGGARGFWHTYVLPEPTLHAAIAKTDISGNARGPGAYKATFSVADAGDPLQGATVVVLLGGTKLAAVKTGAGGSASGTFGGGVHTTLTATASVPGYAKATTTVKVP